MAPRPTPPMQIGHIMLANRLFAAPMAGVTDRPFRRLCKKLGAGYAGRKPIDWGEQERR